NRRAAVQPSREAVTLYRRLAEADPAAHLRRLAAALYQLGTCLAATGDKAEALGVLGDAAEIYQQLLAAVRPEEGDGVFDAPLAAFRAASARVVPVAEILSRQLGDLVETVRGLTEGALTRI